MRPRPERAQRRVLRIAVVQRRPRCASASATTPARALLDASSETVGAIGAWCEDERRGRLVRPVGLPVRLHRRGVRRRGPRARSRPPARSGGRSAVREPRPRTRCGRGCDSPVFRARRAGARLRDRAARAAGARPARSGCWSAGCEIFENSRVRAPSMPAVGGGAHARRDACARARRCSRVGPSARSFRPAPLAPVRDLLAHRADRAGARRARARSAGPAASASPTAARSSTTSAPRATGGSCSAGAAGGSAYGGRVNGRIEVDREVAADGAPRTCSASSPRSRAAGSPTPGAGRSTSRPATSPRSARCRAAPCTSRFGFTGNGVGPHAPGRPRARVAGARPARPLVRACRSSAPRPGAWVPPEPLAWLGGNLVRRAFLRREEAYERGGRPGPLTRALCAVPRALGIHVAR